MARRDWRRWLPPFAVYTGLGVFTATEILLLLLRTETKPPPILNLIVTETVHWYVWGGLSTIIGWLVGRFPFRPGERWISAIVHLLASAALAALHLAIYIQITQHIPGRWYSDQPVIDFKKAWSYFFSARFNTNMLTYFGIFAVIQARLYSRRLREEELARSRLATQLATARLEALKMQLHPHFLFNTLNAISALVHQDPIAAERMILRLSDLLRQALAEASTQEVPLKKEVDFLSTYLEIEQVRFGERLRVAMDIDPEAWDALVPNLLLQPLVENAIRHGIAPVARAGCITVSAHQFGAELELTVADDGRGFPTGGPHREGVGLGTTRARLRELYGSAQSLDIESPATGGSSVRIRIPLRKASLPEPTVAREPA